MDINNPDTVTDFNNRVMYQLRFKFANGKVLSPTEVFESVKKMVKKSGREVRNSVGRVGDLLVGSVYHQGASLFFTFGWYMRKCIETLEKGDAKTPGLGKCTIQYDSEEVSKDMMAEYWGNFLKREGEKMKDLGSEILKGNLPEDLFGEDEEIDPPEE